MEKARKIENSNDFKDNVVTKINEYNEEKVCDFMDETQAFEDMEGYLLLCKMGLYIPY